MYAYMQYVYICGYTCIYVCMYVCGCARVYVYLFLRLCAFTRACTLTYSGPARSQSHKKPQPQSGQASASPAHRIPLCAACERPCFSNDSSPACIYISCMYTYKMPTHAHTHTHIIYVGNGTHTTCLRARAHTHTHTHTYT